MVICFLLLQVVTPVTKLLCTDLLQFTAAAAAAAAAV